MVTSVVTNTTPIRTRPQPPGGASSRWPDHRRRCAHRRCNTPAHRGADRASIRQRYRTVRMDGPAHHPASGRCWHRSGRHPALDHGSAAAGATRRTDVAAGSHRRRHLRRRILRSCSGSRVRVRRTRDVGCRRLTGHGRDCSWHGATCDRHSLHGQLPWCPERRAAAAINTPPAIRAIPPISGTARRGQRLPPSPGLPWLPSLRSGIRESYLTFGECARTAREQPRGDQHCQYDSGKLGHVAGIGAID
jgi:hypothetical protein